ncbi:lactoylglutathione lyase-like isoform X1 [Salvia miltiorrhiza]|uniref:lactoylglutathione lyase-like isoform X1 n=1 Tax=Salvia miltiorrhiza TaxID=226208 RepID=UPI0025ACC373|nr:lactoylglutathione lyase-like isoform X1 [Salvia miltiorrhiza]
MAAAAAQGPCLNHISRETSDIKRLSKFYMEVFGFEQVESPKFEFEVIWLKLGSSMLLHLIERDPTVMLPEGPWSSVAAVADPKNLPRGHHICFYVPEFDSFVQRVKDKGIPVHEKSQPDGKTKQAFFFDPDGESFLMQNNSSGPILP